MKYLFLLYVYLQNGKNNKKKRKKRKKNSKNNGISDPHRLLLNFTDKINLGRSDKYVALSNLGIYCTWKNIKKSYQNNKLKISAQSWNEEFE